MLKKIIVISETFYCIALSSAVVGVEVDGVVSGHDEVSISETFDADCKTFIQIKEN